MANETTQEKLLRLSQVKTVDNHAVKFNNLTPKSFSDPAVKQQVDTLGTQIVEASRALDSIKDIQATLNSSLSTLNSSLYNTSEIAKQNAQNIEIASAVIEDLHGGHLLLSDTVAGLYQPATISSATAATSSFCAVIKSFNDFGIIKHAEGCTVPSNSYAIWEDRGPQGQVIVNYIEDSISCSGKTSDYEFSIVDGKCFAGDA